MFHVCVCESILRLFVSQSESASMCKTIWDSMRTCVLLSWLYTERDSILHIASIQSLFIQQRVCNVYRDRLDDVNDCGETNIYVILVFGCLCAVIDVCVNFGFTHDTWWRAKERESVRQIVKTQHNQQQLQLLLNRCAALFWNEYEDILRKERWNQMRL